VRIFDRPNRLPGRVTLVRHEAMLGQNAIRAGSNLHEIERASPDLSITFCIGVLAGKKKLA
jgi:hypothetical protein